MTTTPTYDWEEVQKAYRTELMYRARNEVDTGSLDRGMGNGLPMPTMVIPTTLIGPCMIEGPLRELPISTALTKGVRWTVVRRVRVLFV